MVSLDVKWFCSTCPFFDANIDKAALYSDGHSVEYETKIRCEHKDICERLEKILQGR